MANAEQLSILKQGADVWNGWRTKNIYVYADLNEADLNGVDLSGADLRIAHLRRANLFRVDLSGADLSGADLSDANLRETNLRETNLTKANLNGASLSRSFATEANLSQANLLAANLRNANFRNANLSDTNLVVADLAGADVSGANLSRTNLTKADLSGIRLRRADLSRARLNRTNLTKSNLVEAKFIETDLTGAIFSQASLGSTVFANSDLSKVIGLETMEHRGPSHISMDTFVLSAGKIPELFLRGCGLSDADIEYAKLANPNLGVEEIRKMLQKIQDVRAAQAPQISPLFISYSDANSHFADKISRKLDGKGIRYWREVHEMSAGQLEKKIDRTIRQKSKVLLILSEHSIKRDWVAQEMKDTGRDVLCFAALDDSWKDGRGPKQVIERVTEYDILDFSAWRNDRMFDDIFRRLLEGLELFHKL